MVVEFMETDLVRTKPFFDRIREIGYQPFIQIGIQLETETEFVICHTQQELAKFADTLRALPHFQSSPFLAGMHAAMSLEFYDSGEKFFEWCMQGDKAGLVFDVLDLSQNHASLPLPLEFPILVLFDPSIANHEAAGKIAPKRVGHHAHAVAGRRKSRSRRAFDLLIASINAVGGFATKPPNKSSSQSSSDRAEGLSRLIKMYHATSGNDAMRWTLMEGAALGASKYYGHIREYAMAMANIRIALNYSPKSIHLRAAEHALELALCGEPVPERLQKFIGTDNGALSDRICPEPFKRFDVGPSGDTLLCCGHWLPTPIGNIMTQEVGDILNSHAARKIRDSMLDGSFKYCNHLECSALIQGYLPKKEGVTDPVLRRAIDHRDLNIEKVEQMLFAFDQSCNLSCPSCRVERIMEKPAIRDAKTEVVANKLMPLLSGLKVLDINPAGEVFSSKPSRRILELVNRQQCPDLVIDIISNGTLFTEKEWAKLPNLKGMVRAVRVSTDGASKPTFEKLRRLASWEVFVKNMEFLGGLRASGEIRKLKMSFTYQLDNFREMKQFVEFGKSFNSDFVIFERLQNLGAYSWDEFRSKAVHTSEHALHQEFLEVIRDPIFGQREVWHDFEWDGVAVLSDKDASERMNTALDMAPFVGA
jgi:Iron-sulfur cluster-binding domain